MRAALGYQEFLFLKIGEKRDEKVCSISRTLRSREDGAVTTGHGKGNGLK